MTRYPSPESWRHRIRNNKLIICPKTLPAQTDIDQLHHPEGRERPSHTLTLKRLPTPSSNPGAKTLLTYRKTESVGLQSSFLRRKLTTVSNFIDAEILKTRVRRIGAEPTGLKRTVTG